MLEVSHPVGGLQHLPLSVGQLTPVDEREIASGQALVRPKEPPDRHVRPPIVQFQDLWTAGDICSEYGIEINNRSNGPAMHAITRADCLYIKDPASGLRIELFAGPGYLNFEPDWEPIEWKEESLGGPTNHQWHGGGPTWDGIDYV